MHFLLESFLGIVGVEPRSENASRNLFIIPVHLKGGGGGNNFYYAKKKDDVQSIIECFEFNQWPSRIIAQE